MRACLRKIGVAALLVFSSPPVALAQLSEVAELKAMVQQMQQQLQKALSRIDQMEKEKAAGASRIEQVEKSVNATQSAPSALNPAIGMAIDATAEHHAEAGGNFNFRSAELGISASVDPYARAYAFFNGGNDGVEVEEAAVVTTSLPWNLQARGGRFFADFGRFPKYHPHELPFVNMPLVVDRLVGGESKADGAELSYLFPTPFFLRGTIGGYNKIGAENDQVNDNQPRAWSRFTYLSRLQSYFDLTDNHSIEVGATLAYTPSVRIAGPPSGGDRTLTGIDLTFRYQPLGATLYQGFTVGGELFGNSEREQRTAGFERMFALGGYSYAEAKLSRDWAAGFLYDNAPSLSSPGKKTIGYSPFVTWNLSEFNRLRFQYSYLDDHVKENKAESGNQFYLQWTTVLGSHTHGFRTR